MWPIRGNGIFDEAFAALSHTSCPCFSAGIRSVEEMCFRKPTADVALGPLSKPDGSRGAPARWMRSTILEI